jgi:hypothetical protein
MADLTEPERLAFAYVTQELLNRARPGSRDAAELQGLLTRLVDDEATDMTGREHGRLADIARREIETNRYPLAVHLGPLKTTFAKLAPNDTTPKPPLSPHRPGRRRR